MQQCHKTTNNNNNNENNSKNNNNNDKLFTEHFETQKLAAKLETGQMSNEIERV